MREGLTLAVFGAITSAAMGPVADRIVGWLRAQRRRPPIPPSTEPPPP